MSGYVCVCVDFFPFYGCWGNGKGAGLLLDFDLALKKLYSGFKSEEKRGRKSRQQREKPQFRKDAPLPQPYLLGVMSFPSRLEKIRKKKINHRVCVRACVGRCILFFLRRRWSLRVLEKGEEEWQSSNGVSCKQTQLEGGEKGHTNTKQSP